MKVIREWQHEWRGGKRLKQAIDNQNDNKEEVDSNSVQEKLS